MSEFDIYAAMQEGKQPLAIYTKTIVGKVHVTALNPFSDVPEGVILAGNKGDPKSSIELWTNKQVVFFERMNGPHIKAGRVIKVSAPQVKEDVSPNQITDTEIDQLLSERITSLKARVEKFTAIPPILRMLNRARELEKSEKIIKYLEEQMAKMELGEYK
jgi:hypothetical protein